MSSVFHQHQQRQQRRVRQYNQTLSFTHLHCKSSPHPTLIPPPKPPSNQPTHNHGRRTRSRQPLPQHHPHRARVPPRLRPLESGAVPVHHVPTARTLSYLRLIPLPLTLSRSSKKKEKRNNTINEKQQPNGIPSAYIDPRYAQGPNYVNMPQLAQAAQDPNHPANPSHPKVSPTDHRYSSKTCYISISVLRARESGYANR